MGLFKKKKKRDEENLPKLPELPEDNAPAELPKDKPELPGEPKEPKNLPPLPNEDSQNKNSQKHFAQEETKEKISEPKMQKSNYNLPNPPQPHSKKTIKKPQTLELSEPTKNYHTKKSTKETKPVYVRLDKFNDTVNTFDDIKSKIKEIEDLLAKTKELKQKETQELENWEKETNIIKSRLDSVDRDIFEKVE